MTNAFSVDVQEPNTELVKEYRYAKVTILRKLNIERFLQLLSDRYAFVDFDAKTGYNHGTKFRLKSNMITEMHDESIMIVDDV